MARWFRSGLSVTAPFVWRCLTSLTILRFHIPLIEPDVRFSRIRLSDKDSCVRTQEVASDLLQLDEAQPLVQVFVREA